MRVSAEAKLVIVVCISLLLLACGLSAPPPWANYVVTIDGNTHYAASYYWRGDELSLVTAEKQVVIFEVGDGVIVEITKIVGDET
jgi:hypothetical protein